MYLTLWEFIIDNFMCASIGIDTSDKDSHRGDWGCEWGGIEWKIKVQP